MIRVFKMTEKAVSECLDWDAAISYDEIETVEEIDTEEDLTDKFMNENYPEYCDSDVYGWESI